MTQLSRLTPRRQAAIFSLLRWTAVLVVVFLLGILGYYLYVNVLNRAPAEVYVTRRDTAIASVYGTVTINPSATLTLFAQNPGYVHTPPELADNIKSQGIAVEKDQLLGTVENQTISLALKTAQADYDNAIARQKNGPANAGPLKSAQDQLRALEKLPPGNVPQVQRDATRNSVNQLTAAVDNENIELRHLVDFTGNALKSAQEAQSRTELRAPFSGILTVGTNEHTYVLPNQAVFAVASTATYVTGQVNEEDVGQLKVEMKADLRLYAYGNKTFLATLKQILPSPEANSSRYIVNLDLDQPPEDIKYGLTGEMNIIVGRKEYALVMPTRALTNVDQVLIVDDGVVEQRTVKIGFKSLDLTEVVEGISEGTQVIVSDQESFRPGQRVRPVKISDVQRKTR